VVTHDHPEGLKGALASTHAIFLARQRRTPDFIRAEIAAIQPLLSGRFAC
jgi:hypothetical protein